MDQSQLSFFVATLSLFLLALGCSLLLHPLAIHLGKLFKIYAAPADRRLSNEPIPRTGGVLLGLLCVVVLLFAQKFTLTLPFTASIGILLILGLYDDKKDLPAFYQAIGIVVAAVIVAVWGEMQVPFVSSPFGGYVFIPTTVGIVLAIAWVFLLINSLNWLDGMDGLAGSVSFVAVLFLAILSWTLGQYPAVEGLAVVLGALLGFLFFNRKPAHIYLGSAGVYILGLWIAFFSLQGGAKLAATMMVMITPILDAGVTFLRRWIEKKPVHKPDNRHGFHALLAQGFTHNQVIGIYIGITILFGFLSLVSNTVIKISAIIFALIVLGKVLLTIEQTNKKK